MRKLKTSECLAAIGVLLFVIGATTGMLGNEDKGVIVCLSALVVILLAFLWSIAEDVFGARDKS